MISDHNMSTSYESVWSEPKTRSFVFKSNALSRRFGCVYRPANSQEGDRPGTLETSFRSFFFLFLFAARTSSRKLAGFLLADDVVEDPAFDSVF